MNYNASWYETGSEEVVEIIIPPYYTPFLRPNSFVFEAVLFLLQKAGIQCKVTVQPAHRDNFVDNYRKWEKSSNIGYGWPSDSDISYSSNSTAKEDK